MPRLMGPPMAAADAASIVTSLMTCSARHVAVDRFDVEWRQRTVIAVVWSACFSGFQSKTVKNLQQNNAIIGHATVNHATANHRPVINNVLRGLARAKLWLADGTFKAVAYHVCSFNFVQYIEFRPRIESTDFRRCTNKSTAVQGWNVFSTQPNDLLICW